MKNEPYYLFLDDNRIPNYIKHVPGVPQEVTWTTVRTFDSFVKCIQENGVPEFISYDHDLCIDAVKEFLKAEEQQRDFNYFKKPMEKTGMHCLFWLLDYLENSSQKHPRFYIHSSNWKCAGKMRDKIFEHNKKFES
jgi:hypothetical protein